MITATVTIDLGPLKKFKSALEADLRRSSNQDVRAAFKKWAARYRAFLRERFSALSRGGGEWPPLSVATLRARRGKFKTKKVQQRLRQRAAEYRHFRRSIKTLSHAQRGEAVAGFNQVTANELFADFGAKAAILIDTGTLFAALDPVFRGKPGQFEEDIDYGISVGYGGSGNHPSGKTVQEIASYHQTGGPRLPRRRIVVPPDQATMNGMAKDMELALQRMASKTGNK